MLPHSFYALLFAVSMRVYELFTLFALATCNAETLGKSVGGPPNPLSPNCENHPIQRSIAKQVCLLAVTDSGVVVEDLLRGYDV